MDFINLYEKLSTTEKYDFTRIVNKLLSLTFIARKKEDNRKDYYFIERYEKLFREYLSLADWTLIADKGQGVYQVINGSEYNRLQLKLEESIILLILRLCYEEKSKEVSMNELVMVRVDEIQEKYRALKIRQQPISKTSLRSTLNLLKRHNLIDNLDRDMVAPETRLLVFPSILLAIRVDSIRQVYDKLKGYSREDELEEEAAATGQVNEE
jgi:hypothetical protein